MAKREIRRAALAQSLLAAAIRRFGVDRAEALRTRIEEVADQLGDIALFPVDREEEPAFYLERSE